MQTRCMIFSVFLLNRSECLQKGEIISRVFLGVGGQLHVATWTFLSAEAFLIWAFKMYFPPTFHTAGHMYCFLELE